MEDHDSLHLLPIFNISCGHAPLCECMLGEKMERKKQQRLRYREETVNTRVKN